MALLPLSEDVGSGRATLCNLVWWLWCWPRYGRPDFWGLGFDRATLCNLVRWLGDGLNVASPHLVRWLGINLNTDRPVHVSEDLCVDRATLCNLIWWLGVDVRTLCRLPQWLKVNRNIFCYYVARFKKCKQNRSFCLARETELENRKSKPLRHNSG